MKLKSINLKNKLSIRSLKREDLKLLQKRVRGKNVYKHLSYQYKRRPKHRLMNHYDY